MVFIDHFQIDAVFGCVPAQIRSNVDDLSPLVGTAKAQAIVASTGFAQRPFASAGTDVFDLVLPAARAAVEGIASEEIGGIVAVSFSAAARFPALSVRLQQALGLDSSCLAVDLQMACAGYPYGLLVAGQLAASTGKRILVVEGDVQSAFVNPQDAGTLAVMSDAGTATLVSATRTGAECQTPRANFGTGAECQTPRANFGTGAECQTPRANFATFAFYTDGAGADVLTCAGAGPITMDGFGVFRFVAGPVVAFLRDFLRGHTPEILRGQSPEIDFFVPHQANLYMIRQLAKSLELADKLLVSGDRFANPGSCSVPLTLAAHPEAQGRILLASFGAGLAASAACVEVTATCRRGVLTFN